MSFSQGMLTEEFRKRRRGLLCERGLSLLQESTHPLSGARLVMARLDKKPYPEQGRYVTGWFLPGAQVLWFYRNFETAAHASRCFQQCQKDGPPLHQDFLYDEQVNAVYGWQDLFQFDSKKLTQPEMETVTQKLAAIFNISAPLVIYQPDKKKTTYAEALLAESKIKMYRPYLSMLLHEFAHLVNDQVNQDKWAWHGPGFMRSFLSILSLFPDLAGGKDIEQHARQAAIEIAEAQDVRSCAVLQDWLRRTHQTDDLKTIPSLI